MNARYPWPTYRRRWRLILADLQVDEKERDDLLDSAHLRGRLDHVDWRTLTVRVLVTTDEPHPDVSDLAAHVLVSSPRTQTRIPFALSGNADAWSGTVGLSRDLLAGAVTVHAEIVGEVTTNRRRLVGSSDSWVLVVDASEAPAPPGAPPFKTAWIDFGEEEAPEVARLHAGAHAVMDLTGEPTLLLNSGLEGFQALLDADKAKLEKRRLRDLFGSNIARYAVATMFRAAAAEIVASVTDENDEPEPPEDRLLRHVCEAVADGMAGVGSAEDLYRRLVDAERGTATDRARFWTEVDLAVDELTATSHTVAEVSKEVRFA